MEFRIPHWHGAARMLRRCCASSPCCSRSQPDLLWPLLYSNAAICQTCVADARGSSCAFCGSVCQMVGDACSAGAVYRWLVTGQPARVGRPRLNKSVSVSAGAVATEASCPGYTPPEPLPGEPFFEDVSSLLATNPLQLNYGVAVTDTNGNGKLEFVVAGHGAANQAFEWNAASGSFHDVATATLQDAGSKAIGVAACDIDGDGFEELYILNTDAAEPRQAATPCVTPHTMSCAAYFTHAARCIAVHTTDFIVRAMVRCW